MATLRVPDEKENRPPEIMQKQRNVNNTKRGTVLGCLDNQTKRQVMTKQPLGLTKGQLGDQNACNNLNIKNNKLQVPVVQFEAIKVYEENDQKLKVRTVKANDPSSEANKNLLPPVVPVAQFEAFKVYEDEDPDQLLKARKLKPNDPSNYYKGTKDDKFVTKKQLIEQGLLKVENVILPPPAEIPNENLSSHMINGLTDNKTLASKKLTVYGLEEFEEYQTDIYQYLREHELFNRPKAGYMRKQPDINHTMRTILVDWLVEVSEEYKLHTETLYLAVNFIDRFLSYMSVVRGKLQLVGTAALFAAAKYEEIYPPEVSEFVYITDDTYNKRQVIRMEQLILKVLSFDMSIATPLNFITVICHINKIPEKTMFLAMYMCELGLLEAEPYLELLPSNLAAGALALARHTLGEEVWPKELVKKTGYELKQLQRSVEFLNTMFLKAPSLQQQTIREKYKKIRYLHVSNITPAETAIEFPEKM